MKVSEWIDGLADYPLEAEVRLRLKDSGVRMDGYNFCPAVDDGGQVDVLLDFDRELEINFIDGDDQDVWLEASFL